MTLASGHQPRALVLRDLNGDGRTDLCTAQEGGLACALGTAHGFAAATRWLEGVGKVTGLFLADVNADGRADACWRAATGELCALAP